jgi:UDP-glucose 4-epimerase
LRDLSKENLFPIVANAIKNNVPISVFGTDYQTRDGSCVRDYVHVSDIARAHLLAARAIEKRDIPKQLNIGTGYGYTVLEVIKEFQRFHKCEIPILSLPRRVGDPATLTADINLAARELGFHSEFGLDQMVSSTHAR